MKFKELKKHLKEGKLSSGYIAFGDDSFVIQNTERLFCEFIATNMPQMNISYFSENDEAESIVNACECMPFMDEKRLVIVKGFLKDGEKIITYLKNPNPSTVLLFIMNAVKENMAKILPLLTPVDCNKLDEENLFKYITATATKNNCSISKDASSLLIAFCLADLARISTELKKLCDYKDGATIEAKDVRELVTADAEYKIFELASAVASQRTEQVALILRSLLNSKIPPVTLLGMLYSHFRRLLFCLINKNEPDLPLMLGIKEYAVKMSTQNAMKYSPLRLKKICDEFHFADMGFKSGEITDILALEVLIMKILS